MIRKILATAFLCAAPALAADDVVMRAMRDELARSMKKLQLENLQKPYFVAYRIVETEGCSAAASFGALTGASAGCEGGPEARRPFRNMGVEVRVGDYARDNTNFFAPRMMTGGVARPLITGGMGVPVDDNYDEIRRQLWLTTDSAYKNALDFYAKKKAALENRNRTDDAPDFSKEPAVTLTETPEPLVWDRAAEERFVKELSALFRETPGIDNSSVNLTVNSWLTRYVNSEGTSYVRSSSLASLSITAETQAVDGMPLADSEVFRARSVRALPARDEIVKAIRTLQTRLDRLRKAALVERYTGPVLFESDAAGELFLQAIGSAMAGVPRVVVDDLRFERAYNANGGLADKIGSRVLPDFLSLTDNPAATEFQGKPLYGGYPVDDEGVKTAPTVLVDKGILKTLLHTRALIAGTTHSTASRRGTGPMPANLMFSADKSLPLDQLKAELLRMTKQRGNDYGIVVRRMANPMMETVGGRSRIIIMSGGSGPGSIEMEPPIEAYKTFPDGHEEMVRNLTIVGLTMGTFKDIAAVSDTPAVYTAPVRMIIRSPMMATSFMAPAGPNLVSMVVPSILFDDMTLQPPKGDIPNLPFTKHPFFDK